MKKMCIYLRTHEASLPQAKKKKRIK